MLRRIFLLALGLTLIAGVAPTTAADPEFEAAKGAIGYIRTLQNADGGFPAFGAGSSPGSTLDAVFAFAAMGRDPTTVTTGGNGPDDYLATQAASYSSDPGAAAKLALGVALMGLAPGNFGGVDLLAVMDAGYDSQTGAYGLDLFDEAFYLLALAAAGEPIPAGAAPYLQSIQLGDGGWEFASGFGSDENTTSIIAQALIAAGVSPSDSSITDALGYLHSVQNADGGFEFVPGSGSDPNSTAFGIQALVAVGEDIDLGGPWAPSGATPLDGLLAFRNPATGAFQFGGFDSAFATYQAVPAVMLAPFPELPRPKQPAPGDTDGDGCTDEQENGSNEMIGGRRDYLRPWDFYDVNGDRTVDLFNDVFGVAAAFGQGPGEPGYTPAKDRSPVAPPAVEPDPARREPWDVGPPDGVVDLFTDIFGVAAQFGHDCSEAP
ncbi:MAG: terpene cyclase/mutase family protein [Dehalococcoidia bacterium]|nr:terpene cyclase/mutase family protein [Dehalococcoidia bacterium]